MRFTPAQLKTIMPSAIYVSIHACVDHLNSAMAEFEINTPLRAAAFIAQIAHETGQLKYLREIWGPTKAQKGYEGRKDLGNTEHGDGKRYLGRGAFQLTGRANYRRYGKALGLPLEESPSLAELPENSFRIAGQYWREHNLNDLADVCGIRAITRAINGGENGLTERVAFYEKAKKVLA